MKKVFAVLLAMTLMMSLGMSVAAAKSPEGVSYYKVYVIDGPGADTEVIKVPVGEDATITATAKGKDFDKWMFYKADGSAAVEGVDYKIVSGTSTDSPITIIPLANIIVTANYDGKITKVEITNDEPHSPQTGDNTVIILSSVMMLALAGAVVAKKQLAK